MPDTTQPAAAVESLSESGVEGSLESLFGVAQPEPEKRAPEEAPEASDADPQELTADDLLEDEQAEVKAPGADDALEIVHNGQTHKLSREEAIAYARQGFDYTQKTQALAENQRQYQAGLQRIAELEQVQPLLAQELAYVTGLQSQLQSGRYSDQEMLRLAREDFVEHAQRSEERNALRNQLQQAASQYQQKAGAVQQYRSQLMEVQLQQEAARLPEVVPAWRDPARLQADKAEMANYLQNLGADMSQIGRYLDNALAMKIVHQSRMYEQLKKAKSDKSGQLRAAPPVIKPGAAAPSTQGRAKYAQAVTQVRKLGRENNHGAQEKLMEQMLGRTFK